MKSAASTHKIALVSLYISLLIWVWQQGKNYNWDLLNYHLYLPTLMWEGRWRQDFFAANIPSYLNPIGYLPIYIATRMGWSDLVIAWFLTTLHFSSVWFAMAITSKLLAANIPYPRVSVALAGAFALCCPIYLLTVGTSFIDPYSSALVLAALYAAVRNDILDCKHSGLAGLLLGLACGLKLTNGIYPVAMFIALVLKQGFDVPQRRRSMKIAASFIFSVFFGFALLHGYWSLKLWTHFSNPFFPFFNSIFRSPDFLASDLRDARFLSAHPLGTLGLPLEMARSESWIYNETPAPDVRPGALLLVLIFAVGAYAKRSKKLPLAYLATHRLAFATAFVLASFYLWATASRIGRYALPTLILIGPLIVIWLTRVTTSRWSTATATALFFAQLFVLHTNGLDRTPAVAWGGEWLNAKIPQEMKSSPATILTVQTQSLASLAPFLHPESSLVNLVGMYSLPSGNRLPADAQRVLQQGNPYLLTSIVGSDGSELQALTPESKADLDLKLSPYGFALSADMCYQGGLRGQKFAADSNTNASTEFAEEFLFCKLTRTSVAETEKASNVSNSFDEILNTIEDSCPGQFLPKKVQTVRSGPAWVRTYFSTANRLYVENGMVLSEEFHQSAPRVISSLSPGDRNLSTIVCPS